jgi:hypothetical protein
MVTDAGDTVTRLVSLLLSATVTGDAAGVESVIGKETVCPKPSPLLAGTPIEPEVTTVTPSVALAIPLTAGAAVMVAFPIPTAVTTTFVVDELPGIVTVAGTVATLVLPDVKLTVNPDGGAGDARFSATVWVVSPLIVIVGDANAIVVVTCTDALPVV